MNRNYCTECGYKLDETTRFCPNCGIKIKDDIPIKAHNKDNNKSNRKITKKHAIIIALAIILGIVIITSLYGELTKPTGNLDEYSVEKDGKLYRINYTYHGDGDVMHIAIYKNGKILGTGDGDATGNWMEFKLNKNVDIDEIMFTVFDDSDNHRCVYTESFNDFKIIKVKNLEDLFADNDDLSGEVDDDTDDFEIAASHRDKYDYDGDGFLNDYEFRQFCIGEGQEELLDY